MEQREYVSEEGLNLFKSLADARYITRDEMHEGDALTISLGENDFMTANEVDSMFSAAFGKVCAADDANFMTAAEVDSLFGGE